MLKARRTLIGTGRARRCAARRGVAAMEFALIAPVMLLLVFGTLDLGRALIAWQQVNYAAEAVVQAAEKLSVVNGTMANPAVLTDEQMQAAMSTIYVEMPGLNKGRGNGLLGHGGYGVTLSEVVYTPTCNTTTGCGTQTPYTYWSSYLQEGYGRLNKPPAVTIMPPERPCDKLDTETFLPANTTESLQLTTIVAPLSNVTVAGSPTPLPMSPQLVADVSFTFVPYFNAIFGFFLPDGGVTFRASATLPTPVGDTSTPVDFQQAGVFVVAGCTVPGLPSPQID
jgi:hypothetical protein